MDSRRIGAASHMSAGRGASRRHVCLQPPSPAGAARARQHAQLRWVALQPGAGSCSGSSSTALAA
eukprot:1523141-Pleurochrysis_carterae.AAC.1